MELKFFIKLILKIHCFPVKTDPDFGSRIIIVS